MALSLAVLAARVRFRHRHIWVELQYLDYFSPSRSKVVGNGTRHDNWSDLAFPECRPKERKILAAPSMVKFSVRAMIGKQQKNAMEDMENKKNLRRRRAALCWWPCARSGRASCAFSRTCTSPTSTSWPLRRGRRTLRVLRQPRARFRRPRGWRPTSVVPAVGRSRRRCCSL